MSPYAILMVLFTIGWAGTRFVYRPEIRTHFGPGLYICVAASLLAGFSFTQMPLFLAVVFLAFVSTVRSRTDALCRCFILCAVLPNPVWGVFPGGPYLFDLSTVAVIMIATSVVLLIHGRRNERPVRGFFAADALALTVVLIFGIAYTRDYSATGLPRTIITALLGLVLPFIVIRRAVRTPDDLRHLIAAWAGAAMILAVIALYETSFGWSLYERIRLNLVPIDYLSASLKMRGGFMRAPTSFMESTSFAVFQVLGVLATVASRAAFRSRLLWYGGVLLATLGLLTAQSRGADLGLLVGGAAMLLFRRRFGLVFAFGSAAAVGVAALFMVAQTNQRVASFIGSNQSYGESGEFNDYRELLLQRGIEEGLKKPLFGDDVMNVVARMPDVVQGEHIVDLVNSYLTIFMASGLVGLFAFLLFYGIVVQRLWAASRPGLMDPERAPLLMFAGGSFAALAVTILFTAFWERNPLWLLVLLASVRPLLAGRQQAARQARTFASNVRSGAFASAAPAGHA